MKLSPLLAIASTSSSTLIQVTFDPSGIPRIDVESGRSLGRPHVVHMGCHGYTATADYAVGTNSVAVSNTRVRNIGVLVPTINSEPIMGVRHRESMTTSKIGIGPGSDLLRRGGQIDFVRQSTAGGFLRLGGSEENFIANDCLPDSIMRMLVVVPDDSTNYFNRRGETRISVSIGENMVATDSVSSMDSGNSLLIMPNRWIADILAMLPPSGEEFGYRSVFTDCARTLQRLPIITLTFTAGGLRLLPEDYTRTTGQDDTCELRIGGSLEWDADQTIRFNPLLIPGINARSTDNEIILCDSAIDL